jgi:sensor histidine kinase YesM
VPFEKELDHLKKYLYIEKLRFDDLLNIEYDIQATDFELPMLSIQPLVENAVKHGVGMKDDGGTVRISTRETDDAFEVIIEDDGVGFDVNAPKMDDGRSHVGMENTKRRLKEMCDADIIITSKVGEGTTARVIIPKKEGKANEDTVS